MNTKEAIEFVKNKWITYLNKQEIKNKNQVIELLHRGGKYKQIVNDIESDFDSLHCNIMSENCFNIIKQKYFPSTIKKTITIEIEGENEDISKFAGRLNTFVGKTNFGVRTNIKEVD